MEESPSFPVKTYKMVDFDSGVYPPIFEGQKSSLPSSFHGGELSIRSHQRAIFFLHPSGAM